MEDRAFEQTLRIERTKAVIDYHKHFTTVSTASLIVVSTFHEKVFPHATHRFLVAFTVLGFLSSIVGSLAVHTIYAAKFPPAGGATYPFENGVIAVGLLATWLGFIAGVAAIALFVLVNVF